MSETSPVNLDLLRWSETLSAIAGTRNLVFTASAFERERYEEILKVAADIAVVASASNGGSSSDLDADKLVAEWLQEIPSGMEGYRTPRVSVGALVGNDKGELLLVQRADSGRWLYPTGWADVGYSAAEVAVKEVAEETGMEVEAVRLAMVIDGMRLGQSRTPMYSLVFHCRILGGELKRHPLECSDVGWFGQAELPEMLAGRVDWADHAFKVIRGETTEVRFDRPRDPAWRQPSA